MDNEPSRIVNLEPYKPLRIVDHGDFFIIVTREGVLVELSVKDSQYKRVIQIEGNNLNILCLKNSKVFAGFGDGEIRMLDQNYKSLKTIGKHNDELVNLVFVNKTQKLYSASEDCTVFEWNLSNDSNKELYRHPSPILIFGYHSKSKRLISGCSENFLIIYSLNSNSIENQITLESKPWSLGILKQNPQFIIGDHDGNVLIFNLDDPSNNIKKFNVHDSRIKDITIKSDQSSFFTVSFDQTASQISVKDQKKLKEFNYHKDWIRAALYRKPEDCLITIGDDCLVCFWKVDESPDENKKEIYPV